MAEKLIIQAPDAQTPGFLRRQIAINKIRALGEKKDYNLDYWQAVVDFILDYVEEPADRDKARDILLDLSAEDYTSIMKQVSGNTDDTDENPTSPDEK